MYHQISIGISNNTKKEIYKLLQATNMSGLSRLHSVRIFVGPRGSKNLQIIVSYEYVRVEPLALRAIVRVKRNL